MGSEVVAVVVDCKLLPILLRAMLPSQGCGCSRDATIPYATRDSPTFEVLDCFPGLFKAFLGHHE